jgi:hypothetical protein
VLIIRSRITSWAQSELVAKRAYVDRRLYVFPGTQYSFLLSFALVARFDAARDSAWHSLDTAQKHRPADRATYPVYPPVSATSRGISPHSSPV